MIFVTHRRSGDRSPGAQARGKPLQLRRKSTGLALAALVALLGAAPRPALAQAQDGGARLLAGAAEAGLLGRRLTLRLRIEGAAPFRVFTLDAPPRLVVDLLGALGPSFTPGALEGPVAVTAARAGPVRPGWARLVLDLDRPLALRTAELRDGVLEIRLARVSPQDFAAVSRAPPGVWPPAGAERALRVRGAGSVTVAIDAGHGGLDPGAVREGLEEKDIALAFARELATALAATGRLRAVLVREGDEFLGLSERVASARAAGADALVSVHTNAAAEPGSAGAMVFTRSETGSDGEAAARARLENDADARGGVAAAAPGDPVAQILDGLARVETDARSRALAGALLEALAPTTGLAPFPERSADFIVLGDAELPSVLLELGFLSNPADRAAMTDPVWRARVAAAVAAGVELWLARDAEFSARLRR